MPTSPSHVSHLLWCMLVALHGAEGDGALRSEKARRRFLCEWLSTARRNPAFSGVDAEITALRQLVISERDQPVSTLLHALHEQAGQAGVCDLFRFRAALGSVMRAGWKTGICASPDLLLSEVMTRSRGRQARFNHLLQLTDTPGCFSVTGEMIAPVTFQVVTREDSDDSVVTLAFAQEQFQTSLCHRVPVNRHTEVHTLYVGAGTLPESRWCPAHKTLH